MSVIQRVVQEKKLYCIEQQNVYQMQFVHRDRQR